MLGAEAGPACTARGTIHPPRAPPPHLWVRPRHPWVPPRGLGRRPRYPASGAASTPRPAAGTVRRLPSVPRPAPRAAPLSPAPLPSAQPRSPQPGPAPLSPAPAPSTPGSLSALPREWLPSQLPPLSRPLKGSQKPAGLAGKQLRALRSVPPHLSVFTTPPYVWREGRSKEKNRAFSLF